MPTTTQVPRTHEPGQIPEPEARTGSESGPSSGSHAATLPTAGRPVTKVRSWRRVAAMTLAGALAFGAAAGAGLASDEGAWKDLESRYKKLSRNKDEAANRERRKLILQSFDFLDQKTSRKFLRDAWDDEPTADGRIAVVQVLAATGDPKDVEFLLNAFKKEKLAGPVIALGQGLSFTSETQAAAISVWAAGQVAKQKGEVQRSLLEGLGELGDASAVAILRGLAGKLDHDSEIERLIALGACGQAGAKEDLERAAASPDTEIRIGAAAGLARTGGPGAPPAESALPALTGLLADPDPRIVEICADALAGTKYTAAVKPLAEALRHAPLRVRESIRAALKAITGRDAGHDADAWIKDGGTAPPPTLPKFAGIDVATDRVAVILDLSKSMDSNSRLFAAQTALTQFLATLPDDAFVGALAVGRTTVSMSEKLGSGPAHREQIGEWLGKQMTAWGFDLREALLYVTQKWPNVDTIVIAGDSAPWGDAADITSLEVIQQFRRQNRHHRIRVHAAFTAPGGRHVESEPDAEAYADSKELLKQFAESTGGKFVAQE